MKKILSLCLFLLAVTKLCAQDTAPVLFPVVDGKVIYEKVVDVENTSAGTIHVRAFKWILDTFKERETISDDLEAAQSIYRVKIYPDIYTIDFTIQVDAKDNKYRYRIFDITQTVTGKTESSLFAKYLVNVPADRLNRIVLDQEKGYGKGQKKDAQKSIILIQEQINAITNSLQKAVAIKKADF